ncbi:MAG: uroporphyrinogen decarboxylase family protein [Armatimonadota bacterium]
MTSRQRVVAAFEHTGPDRTPIWEKLIKSPAADELLGRPCAASNFHYQMERLADGDWEGLVRQQARDEVELAEILGFDLIRLYPNAGPPAERPVRLSDTTWRTGNYYQERMSSGWIRGWLSDSDCRARAGTAPSAKRDANAEADREAALRASLSQPPPPLPQFSDLNYLLIREAKAVMAEKDLDLPIFCAAYGLGVASLPPFQLQWFVTDRPLLHEYYRRNMLSSLHHAKKLVEEGADIIGLGGDFASDHGPICSPRDYAEFIAPNLREQSRALHALGVYTSNASDGNLWSVLDDFLVTAEVDGFEEMDFAAGMDMKRLRERYPDKTMIGNIDIRHTLTSGTKDQVRAHTIQCLKDGWGEGDGGHLLMSGNCIHEHVKVDLFLEHLATYRDFFGLS